MSRLHRLPAAAAGLLALAASATAVAQYKVVSPDGRITYTDRPTETTAQAVRVQPVRPAPAPPAGLSPANPAAAPGGPAPAGAAGLPYELRQVAERFPVTLYSRAGCPACDQGRSALRRRGIPYAERTVGTDADVVAFTQIEGVREVPLLRIGGQQLRGYSELEWSSYLDAAGYPKTSRLPAGYRGWDPAPLVAERQQAEAVPPATPSQPARLPPALEAAPGGIRF